jgi:hypothetical protein
MMPDDAFRMGWNPLCNVKPLGLLEELASKSVADSFPQLVPPPGPQHVRWPFSHNGDRLVHSLMGLYHTHHWQTSQQDYVPVEAITECGVLALLRSEQYPGVMLRYDSGVVVLDGHVTCLACASGVAEEGRRYRKQQKENAHREAFSSEDEAMVRTITGRTSYAASNMRQVPRKMPQPPNLPSRRRFGGRRA